MLRRILGLGTAVSLPALVVAALPPWLGPLQMTLRSRPTRLSDCLTPSRSATRFLAPRSRRGTRLFHPAIAAPQEMYGDSRQA